jgi:hypothetical protein
LKYAITYIDQFFESLEKYDSKVELLKIAYSELKDCNVNEYTWFIELCEVMNWQAMSDRSGVWTYYEVVYPDNSQIFIESMKYKKESEMLNVYMSGIEKYENEDLMDEIDQWIRKNELQFYKYIDKILIENKDWFYNL